MKRKSSYFFRLSLQQFFFQIIYNSGERESEKCYIDSFHYQSIFARLDVESKRAMECCFISVQIWTESVKKREISFESKDSVWQLKDHFSIRESFIFSVSFICVAFKHSNNHLKISSTPETVPNGSIFFRFIRQWYFDFDFIRFFGSCF